MAKRKPGGQPGNKNAHGHKGANAFSPGRSLSTPGKRRKAAVKGIGRAIRNNPKAAAKGAAILGTGIAAATSKGRVGQSARVVIAVAATAHRIKTTRR